MRLPPQQFRRGYPGHSYAAPSTAGTQIAAPSTPPVAQRWAAVRVRERLEGGGRHLDNVQPAEDVVSNATGRGHVVVHLLAPSLPVGGLREGGELDAVGLLDSDDGVLLADVDGDSRRSDVVRR